MKKIILLFLLITNICYSQGDCPNTCITTGGSYLALSGVIQELNAGNRGCLSANEANSSYWFQVCFTTSGVYQFFINPSGNRNDFDFAVWNGIACPPNTTPIRCSWAAVPPGGPCATCDFTGLGNGAVDLSEGAGGNQWVAPINVVAGQCLTININNYGSGSNNFTIDLTGTTATMSCLLLPIELLSFTGYVVAHDAILSWETATETNSDYYDLQKTIDGVNWSTIATIPAAGNSNQILHYSHIDHDLGNGIYYYRLKQVDYNGQYKIYDNISIQINDKDIPCVGGDYYNLTNQKIDIENAPVGIYIRLCNGKTDKIYKTNE